MGEGGEEEGEGERREIEGGREKRKGRKEERREVCLLWEMGGRERERQTTKRQTDRHRKRESSSDNTKQVNALHESTAQFASQCLR